MSARSQHFSKAVLDVAVQYSDKPIPFDEFTTRVAALFDQWVAAGEKYAIGSAATLIAEAEMNERDRCAKIAERERDTAEDPEGGASAAAIAIAIRSAE